jgi:toxin ParE1/3/4
VTTRVIWEDEARQDFDAAIAFLEAQSPSAARRIGDRILKAVGLLERFPEIAPPSRHRGLRQLVVSQTPYLVVYRVHEDAVEIRAVVHAGQRRRK